MYLWRDEANCKISILKEKSDKEYYQYSQEISELSRLLEHEQKTRDFINTKNAERKVVTAKGKSGNKKGIIIKKYIYINNKKNNIYIYIFFFLKKKKKIKDF